MKHGSPNTVCSFRLVGACNLFANSGYCETTDSSCRSVGQPSVVVNKYFVREFGHEVFPGKFMNLHTGTEYFQVCMLSSLRLHRVRATFTFCDRPAVDKLEKRSKVIGIFIVVELDFSKGYP